MRPSLRTSLLYGLAAAATALAAAKKVRDAWVYAEAADPASASDSLPLYLGARAVSQGLDPTDQATLEAVYAAADINVTKALFSVLYPPSIHVLLQPIAELSHYGFLYYWRLALLGVLILGMAAAGTVGLSRTRAPLGAALGVFGAFAFFPLFVDVQLGLGQPNVIIVGLFGLAMGASAWGANALAACAAVVGTAIKLVPAIVFWPMLWARRWRGLGAAAVLGALGLGITVAHVPIGRIMANLADTLAFQQTVEPHWLHVPSLPDWGRFVGYLRRPALMLMSLGLSGYAVWSNRANPGRRREATAVSIGLLATALAADSAGVGAYYATMAMPGMAVLVSWPLAARAGRLAWLGLPASATVLWMTDGGLIYNTPDVELKLVLSCCVMWAVIALRLLLLARPWSRRAIAGVTLAVMLATAHASLWTWRPPFRGHKTLPEAAPGSMTTPDAPPMAPLPHDGTPR